MSNEFGIGGVQAGLRRMAALLPQFCGAFAAGLVAGAIETGDDSTGAIVLGAYLVAGWYSARAARWRWLLPMAGLLAYGVMAVLGTVFSIIALQVMDQSTSFLPLAFAAFAAVAALIITGQVFSPSTRIRIGVIGSPNAALRLRKELDREQSRGFEVGADDRARRLGLRPTRRSTRPISARCPRSAARSTTATWRRSSSPASSTARRSTAGSSPRSWPARCR